MDEYQIMKVAIVKDSHGGLFAVYVGTSDMTDKEVLSHGVKLFETEGEAIRGIMWNTHLITSDYMKLEYRR